ncbi:T-box transcription factor TBX6 [Osmerus mordax]|uniref:T-box transcription factor TBX6 n=1 Tax=Osmerus mordax TaxID=8014 RepID=UPI00351068AB
MLSVEMYPSLALGTQRHRDCYYREREAPPHIPLCPAPCDMAARALAPSLLTPPPVPSQPISMPQDDIKMELENTSLWKQFSSVGTEMIITKKGRRMFPQLRVKLSGLNPSLRYILLLDIVPLDSSRYRFQGDSWQVVGGAEARLPDRVFIHPDSPASGAHWQSRTVSFHNTKLTNNTLDTHGHIILHSLHRYQPRVHVVEARDMQSWAGGQRSFLFPETHFLTVTAYQNHKITELKINSNPFAKGFRQDGMNNKRQRDARQKRKLSQVSNMQDGESAASLSPSVSCGPCDSTQTLASHPPELQTLTLASLPLLPSPSCGFSSNQISFQETPLPDPPLQLGHAYVSSQIADLTVDMVNGQQDATGSNHQPSDSMIDRSGSISLPPYTQTYPDTQHGSMSFSSSSLPQPSSSYPSLPPPEHSGPSLPHPSSQTTPSSTSDYPSLPSSDYPSILSSSPSLPHTSTTSPLLHQTSFTYPPLTPPSSTSSSPQPLLSSSSYHSLSQQELVTPDTPPNTSFPLLPPPPCPSLLTPPPHTQQADTGPPQIAFSFPDLPPSHPNQSQPLQMSAPLPSLPFSLSGSASYPFPSFPSSIPNSFSVPNPIQLPPPSSLPNPPYQPSSAPHLLPSTFTNYSLPPSAHPLNPGATHSSSYPPVAPTEMGSFSQFPPGAHYLPEMVLHHPTLLETSLSSYPPPSSGSPTLYPPSSAPPALYPSFSSYPLRLYQDPCPSYSLPLRHVYRQPQLGHTHAQGSYLDMSGRAMF